jgi:HNH endonuclease
MKNNAALFTALLLALLFCTSAFARGSSFGRASGFATDHFHAVPGIPRDSHGRILRSSAARMRFLHMHHLTHTPRDCQVDHVKPLALGGADDPSNMQLLCGETLKAKEKSELQR